MKFGVSLAYTTPLPNTFSMKSAMKAIASGSVPVWGIISMSFR